MQIVVADDDRFSRELVQHTLRSRTEHVVTTVADGHLALECALTLAPDALILDWMMPTMTGTEVCRRIRAESLPRQPYILLVTAKNQRDELIEGLSVGADDLLSKPVSPDVLLARLRSAERQRRTDTNSVALVTAALRSARAEGDGELVVRDADVTARVYFQSGAVAWAHVSDDKNTLFEILAPESGVDADSARAIVEECRQTGARLSDTLVRWGLTDRANLRNSIQLWIKKKIDVIARFGQPQVLFLPQRRRYAEDMLFDLEELLPTPALDRTALSSAEVRSQPAADVAFGTAFTREDTPEGLALLLDRCIQNDEVLGVAVLNRATGSCLGLRGAELDPNLAWSYLQSLNVFSRKESVEDAVVVTARHYHWLRSLPKWPNCVVYALIDAQREAMSTARWRLKQATSG